MSAIARGFAASPSLKTADNTPGNDMRGAGQQPYSGVGTGSRKRSTARAPQKDIQWAAHVPDLAALWFEEVRQA